MLVTHPLLDRKAVRSLEERPFPSRRVAATRDLTAAGQFATKGAHQLGADEPVARGDVR